MKKIRVSIFDKNETLLCFFEFSSEEAALTKCIDATNKGLYLQVEVFDVKPDEIKNITIMTSIPGSVKKAM